MKLQSWHLTKSALILSILVPVLLGCAKQENNITSTEGGLNAVPAGTTAVAAGGGLVLNALPNPSWHVDARCFLDGPTGSFDDVAVKDPSIVYSGGKYHLFYTGRDATLWRMGYASSSSISGLKTAPRTFMSALQSGTYFCAPQVFYFPVKGKWFLIYQNAHGASFSTSTDVANPSLWTPTRTMGFSDGIDFWVISDGTYVYCFYSAQDGSHTIKRRRTTVANFPYTWSEPTVCATETFEGPHVYKSNADGKYYMMVEDLARHQELWTASSLGGTWSKVSEQWAAKADLVFNGEVWTDQVSHAEIIRAGINERMEINNIDHCEVLIQGVLNGSYGGYANTPYDLGLMRNY
jgi:hypothetical protein